MARYIDADKIDFRLPYFTDENGDVLVSLKTVKRCIAMTPTADVVPKSEVAREIFEDIEKIRLEFLNKKITDADMVVKLFLLKKKYTEGNDG